MIHSFPCLPTYLNMLLRTDIAKNVMHLLDKRNDSSKCVKGSNWSQLDSEMYILSLATKTE